MKRFSFSLDKVLRYKIQIENSVRNQHARAAQAVFKQEEFIGSLELEQRKHIDDFKREREIGCTINRFRTYEDYLSKVQQRINSEIEVLEELKREEEKKRAEVIKAKVETSSIEKLKEKKREEYDKEAQKAEEQLIEEFVSNASAAR